VAAAKRHCYDSSLAWNARRRARSAWAETTLPSAAFHLDVRRLGVVGHFDVINEPAVLVLEFGAAGPATGMLAAPAMETSMSCLKRPSAFSGFPSQDSKQSRWPPRRKEVAISDA